MAKVWCAEIECKHNRNNMCRRKEVKFSAGHVHTIHQGFLHVWQCKDYELSEDAKKIMEVLKKQFPTSAKMEG